MQNTVRYMQILAYFTDIIDAGKMQEGDQMPTENEICTLFNVSRTTVRMALNALCQNGYIYKIQGKGSFVAHKETDMQLNHLYGFSDGQKVHVFERLRFADAVPMALEKVHLPFHRFPGLKAQDVTASLYKLLSKEYGCERSRAEQSIRADAADRHAAKALELKSGMPVLRITRVTFDHSGVPFEYVESIYRGDKYVFNVSLGL